MYKSFCSSWRVSRSRCSEESEEDALFAARSVKWSYGLILLAWLVHASARGTDAAAQPAASNLPPPVHLTAEQDHQRTMDLLHIMSLRRGADGNAESPNAANYDESKANLSSKLPAVLVLKNGKKVTSAKLWWKRRR